MSPVLNHVVERTNSFGVAFVGRCLNCGKTGLTSNAIWEACLNPLQKTEDESVIAQRAFGGSFK